MFDADRPIVSAKQDRLSRSLFSKYLARCMLDHKDPESMVVGLYGGWGSGKSSIINLAVEELRFAASNMPDDEKPILLNFSPWSYSGQGQLIYSFFRRLSSAIRSEPDLKNAETIIYLLELYVSFFTQKPIPKPFRPKSTIVQKVTGKARQEAYAWESGRDLTLVKAQLNELLKQQNRKIIIMIDNISRLYPQEIKQIFQIVKSMGDYANTIYLLAFDKEQIIHAINEVDGSGGQAYVEKIVQLPFEIPAISQQDMEAILVDRLKGVLAVIPADAWNNEYWADIYYSSLKYLFQSCRDITRYANTLNFSYLHVRDVVNPVDFFALTAIEVFMPEIYAGICENKDLFSDLLDNVYALDKDMINKDKKRCDEIMARTTRLPRDKLLNLLINLFPRLRHIYQPGIKFYHSDALARQLRRACSPDLFDTYFRLSLQVGQLQPTEFDTILAMASDPKAFDQALTRLNQDERIGKFLDMLDSDAIQHIPQKDVQSIVNALIDNGDLFPQGTKNPLSMDTPRRVHRIIHRLLGKYKTSEERFIVLQKAIANATKSIAIIVYELREQTRQHTEESRTYVPLEMRDLAPDHLASLQKLAVTRIEQWAKTGRLADHPHLHALLYAWCDWGNLSECKHFVEELTNTDRGLITFLCVILDEAISQIMTNHERSAEWSKYLDDISLFIAVKMLEAHAKTLFEDQYFEKLREREQLAVMIFLDLIKAQTLKVIPKTTI